MTEVNQVSLKTSPGPATNQIIRGNNYTITQLPGTFAEEGPIFTDVDNDGLKEVIVSTDTFPDPQRHLLYVIKPDGTIKTGWPKPNENDWGWYDSAKCLSGDIHASAGKEVILTNWDGTNIYTCNGDLLKRFPDRQWAKNIANFINPKKQLTVNGWSGSSILNENLNYINSFPFSISAAADINNDGEAEIIGYKNTQDLSQWQIFVVKPDGTNVTGWPKELLSFFPDNSNYNTQTIAADINRDGNYEIFFLMGKMEAGSYTTRTKIWGLNKNGQILPNWEKTFSNTTRDELYITNTTNRSYPDLVFFDTDNNQFFVFDYKGNQICQKKFLFSTIFNPPVFCDINRDGISEMIYSYGSQFLSYNFLTNSEKEFFNPDPSEVGVGSIVSSFAVGDIDRDGLLEVICGIDKNNQCGLLIGQTAIKANPLPGLDWPMLNRDPERTNSQPKLPAITGVKDWREYK